MHTAIVWALIFSFGGSYNSGNVGMIQDIATQQDCQRLAASVTRLGPSGGYPAVESVRCVQYRKVVRAWE